MATERKAVINIPSGELKDVIIIDNGENYDESIPGQIPNHDKIEIVYEVEK